MADTETSKEDRQLAASGKKIHKARMQGNLPRSRDVGHALVLGAALAAFVALGPSVGEATLEIVRHGLRFGRPEALEPDLVHAFPPRMRESGRVRSRSRSQAVRGIRPWMGSRTESVKCSVTAGSVP